VQCCLSLYVRLEGQKSNGEYDEEQLAANLPRTLECARRYDRCPRVSRRLCHTFSYGVHSAKLLFTEGYDTKDLQEAKALLAELT